MENEMKLIFDNVRTRMTAAYSRCQQRTKAARLVAVSKTQPKAAIIEAYGYGQRHFGENYVQELIEKANDEEIIAKCSEIRWHFIGHLQSNKVPKIVGLPNLHMIETVDSIKIADALNKGWMKLEKEEKLKVMVQVNTSRENNKSGIECSQVPSVVNHIAKNCESLSFAGLMTIGAFDHDSSKGSNPDFIALADCRDRVCSEIIELKIEDVELSMGMSNDFEHAIEMGSTNVRVGTTLFGARNYS